MPKPEQGEGLFRTVRQFPSDRSNVERVDDFEELMRRAQRLELDNMGKLVVVRRVENNRPKQILIVSDFHLGSVASNLEDMKKLRDYVLNNPDVGVLFAGDEIEGNSGGKYNSTIDTKTKIDVQQQVEFLRIMFFGPLAATGQICGMVSEYWAHPGWIFDATTLNIWRTMVWDLGIPIIQNGGDQVIQFPNGYEHAIKVWHNPPGASKDDELSGQRTVMQKTSESARPKGSVAGHIHRIAVAEEIYAGAKHTVYYISAGTTKGSSPDMPRDPFGVRLGLGLAEPQGQGVTIVPGRGRKPDINIPFGSLKEGKVAIEAVSLLDRVEAQGMRDELLGKIHNKVEDAPNISYCSDSSRLGHRYKDERPLDKLVIGGETIMNPYSHMEMKVPYSLLSYEIQTRLPIALHLIANARIGAGTEGYKGLRGYMKNLAERPHALMVFLRNMIDKEAGHLPNRIEVLDRLVDLIKGNSGQTLAIMMCESMRQGAWKSARATGEVGEYINEQGKTKTRKIYTPPVAPASYVATATAIPLIHHLSLLKLAIGPGRGAKTIYSGTLADKLDGHGSNARPEWGLSRLYDLHIHEKPGFVTGGHMKHAGAMRVFDPTNAETNNPIFVAPGWWADAVDSMGKGNVQVGAEPGQAIIFMPGKGPADYLTFPTVSTGETEYMHDALMLLRGLEILGLTEKVLKKK